MVRVEIIAACAALGAAATGAVYCLVVRRKKKTALKGKKEKVAMELVEIRDLAAHSKVFVFAFPDPTDILGLPVGQHISLAPTINDKVVPRSYTPVTGDELVGKVELAVKIYPDGKVTQYLDHMKIGDSIPIAGPKGEFEYHGHGRFTITKRGYPEGTRKTGSFGMIAGGSGLTPCLQVLQAIFADPTDKTKVNLIYANQTDKDIWYKEELERFQRERPGQVNVWYATQHLCRPLPPLFPLVSFCSLFTPILPFNFAHRFVLSNAPKNWSQGSGYVTADTMKTHMADRVCRSISTTPVPQTSPPPVQEMNLLCGPPPMLKAMGAALDSLRVDKHDRFVF